MIRGNLPVTPLFFGLVKECVIQKRYSPLLNSTIFRINPSNYQILIALQYL